MCYNSNEPLLRIIIDFKTISPIFELELISSDFILNIKIDATKNEIFFSYHNNGDCSNLWTI